MRWRDVGWVQRSRRARRVQEQSETQEPSKVPAPPPTLRPTTPFMGGPYYPSNGVPAKSKDKGHITDFGDVRVMIAIFTGAKTFHETRLDLANPRRFFDGRVATGAFCRRPAGLRQRTPASNHVAADSE